MATAVTIIVLALAAAAGVWNARWNNITIKDNTLVHRGQEYPLAGARATVDSDRSGWRSQKAQTFITVSGPDYSFTRCSRAKGSAGRREVARAQQLATQINDAASKIAR
jgi:hypothetical protein